MDVQDAQREVRLDMMGGFWGNLVYSAIWLVSAALGTWVNPTASILAAVIGGFFGYPLLRLALRLSGRPMRMNKQNPLHGLGMQVAFMLVAMVLLVPVAQYRLNLFFPALMILVGAHYFPFATMFGMRMWLALGGILIVAGILIAYYFGGSFTLGAWVTGLVLFVFAWIGRSIAAGEARTQALAGVNRAT